MNLINLVWFRRDLRLMDNEMVWRANQGDMLPFFIVDPWFYQQPEISPQRVNFLLESLTNLDGALRQRGSKLILLHGDSFSILRQLTQELLDQNFTPHLLFNRDIQVIYGLERDKKIIHFYQDRNLPVTQYTNYYLSPDEHRNDWLKEYYRYQNQPLYSIADHISTPEIELKTPQIYLTDITKKYGLNQPKNPWFTGGESQAQATLNSFLARRFHGYHWKISRPWLTQQGATSHLSPHLTFGTISGRQVYQKVQQKRQEYPDHDRAVLSLRAFRDRLRWRDSASQRLSNNPNLVHQNIYPEFDEWYNCEPLTPEKQMYFSHWQNGTTGFPLVDASMRQLRQMGWMNFRMRAMCATFLTINCGISWHYGAQHYMRYLIDGDLAIDHWQWQMQAGITNPLSANFRIYNPERNAQERDQNWQFIHYWVSELRGIQPQDWGNVTLSSYPEPMLNWSETRHKHGQILRRIREQVRQRLYRQQGREFAIAQQAQNTLKNYHQRWRKYYQQAESNYGQQLSLDFGDLHS